MPNQSISTLRENIRLSASACQNKTLEELQSTSGMRFAERESARVAAHALVEQLRGDNNPGLVEVFLAEYGLSTDEGVALMCLAEALLRIPDSITIDDLIEDKIVSSNWNGHLGKSSSALVNTATWGLLFTDKLLDDNHQNKLVSTCRGAVKRLGAPVIRMAVKRAMKEMGNQFVLGETIGSALKRGERRVAQGYTYSFDMLGEQALTKKDADRYFESYKDAIEVLGSNASSSDIKENPGISIKLSALHPRYEANQHERVKNELIPDVLRLAQLAKIGNLGLNIDAEEADRLDLSLDVIQGVLEDPSLVGWDGFGVVVQAYNKSASSVLDWLYALAQNNDRQIMVRLVKGAYWDTEIKLAQAQGLRDYPVFTRKAATDISYLCCAKKLMSMGDRIFAQFATHNAHTIAAVLAISNDNCEYEFQRLHGMGEGVFDILRQKSSVRCRIYAPVGKHKDLLAYLVRRLLENSANSSFVNQVIDLDVLIDDVIEDPFESNSVINSTAIALPKLLFQPERVNSRGWDLNDHVERQEFEQVRAPFLKSIWKATPLMAEPYQGLTPIGIMNPGNFKDVVGSVVQASEADVDIAIKKARPWHDLNAPGRAKILLKAALLLEENSGEIFAILAREAGKTANDAVSELREAVDFLRYYAVQAQLNMSGSACGVFVCISPWNFPLAIFLGQISAALAAGNGVLAKPAESTPLIAFLAVKLLYQAGVPKDVLQLLPGQGTSVGAKLASAQLVNGICFTGSTATGLHINRSMAKNMAPAAPLIAETGGINAMIVDSSALPEQAIPDIVNSAFQSAGQRCSALRVLYVQEEIYDDFIEMLYGAIDQLTVGEPWALSTDIGPVISALAHQNIKSYVERATRQGRLMKTLHAEIPESGHFLAPTVIEVGGIMDIEDEIFGPVLHVAKFHIETLDQVIEDLNASGYGLTFGLHTRIDNRIERVINNLNVGNIYVNRDQIGAVVGSQPFGGENLSGTGPKAGGPNYIKKFMQTQVASKEVEVNEPAVYFEEVQTALNSLNIRQVRLSEQELTGPTGESNKFYEYGRGVVLCLGTDFESAQEQARIAEDNGCPSLIVCPGARGNNAIDGFFPREFLKTLHGFSLVTLWSSADDLASTRRCLAAREGRIIPMICDDSLDDACKIERHVCVNTTAAGGNISLLAAV